MMQRTTLSGRTVGVCVLLIALAPDTPALFLVLGSPMTMRRLAMLLVGCLIILWALTGRLHTPRIPSLGLWISLTGIVLLGTLYGGRPAGFLLWVAFIIVPLVIGAAFSSSDTHRKALIWGLGWAGVLLSVAAMVEFWRGESFFPPVDAVIQYTRSDRIRAFAGWQHPLALGMFLSMTSFLVLALPYPIWSRGALATLCFGGILATQQRSPLLGLLAGSLTLAVFTPGFTRRIRIAFAAIGGVALFLFLPLGALVESRHFLLESLSPGTEASGTVTYRSILLEVGIRSVTENPWLGNGFGSVTNGLNDFLIYGNIRLADVANTPLALALETGLLGLMCFLGILGAAIARLWRGRTDGYSPFLAGGIMGAAVTSLGVMTIPSLGMLMLLVGASARAPVPADEEAGPPQSGSAHARTRA